jgi:hypothetical protein
LLGVHSRCGLHTRAVTVFRDPLSEGFRHFVTSMPAPVASGWSRRRVGLAPTEGAAFSRRTPKTDLQKWSSSAAKSFFLISWNNHDLIEMADADTNKKRIRLKIKSMRSPA